MKPPAVTDLADALLTCLRAERESKFLRLGGRRANHPRRSVEDTFYGVEVKAAWNEIAAARRL
jgi:hypothetical protein